MAKKKKQVAGKCIFCGKGGLTKQHIMPDWIKNIIPRGNIGYTAVKHSLQSALNILEIKPQASKFRPGDIGSKTLRNVCETCNKGWMSSLEQLNKPILEPLMKGEEITLTQTDIINLSKWVLMTVYVVEFEDLTTKAIQRKDVEYFLKENSVPDNWKISIGRIDGKEWFHLRRKHLGIGLEAALVNNDEDVRKIKTKFLVKKVQSTTIVLGKLLIVASSTSEDKILPAFKLFNTFDNYLMDVWPLATEVIHSNSKEIIDDDIADSISDAIYNELLRNKHKYVTIPVKFNINHFPNVKR